jgi:catechol 2,3-dioxygenase-like lactoylglutathione lyase family enzyme
MLEFDLDHVGVAIESLEAGRAAYARLGFRLTARSQHAGSRTPGAPVEPWGSGNHCAMFGSGYLEVVGLTDPTLYTSVRAMVSKYQGLHIVALGCKDADQAVRALTAAGVRADAPRTLERDTAFGAHDESVRRARFRNVHLDRAAYVEARFLVIEHLTRDLLWQPHLLSHPNGALALAEVHFCAADAQATARNLARLTGGSITSSSPGRVVLALRAGRLIVRDPAIWGQEGPGSGTTELPCPVGFGIQVGSLAATRDCLAASGIEPLDRDGLWIHPAYACGSAVRFFQDA